jgi:hypothetical protein
MQVKTAIVYFPLMRYWEASDPITPAPSGNWRGMPLCSIVPFSGARGPNDPERLDELTEYELTDADQILGALPVTSWAGFIVELKTDFVNPGGIDALRMCSFTNGSHEANDSPAVLLSYMISGT